MKQVKRSLRFPRRLISEHGNVHLQVTTARLKTDNIQCVVSEARTTRKMDNDGWRVSNNYAVIPGGHGHWPWGPSMAKVLELNESNKKY